MTSNGIALERKLSTLKTNGLNALNISLDTMDPLKFQLITRRNGFEKVMRCIDEALRIEIDSLKVNCVVMKGINENEILKFVEFIKHRPLQVRFIEYMPFDGNKWNFKKFVSFKEMTDLIECAHGRLERISQDPNDTSKDYRLAKHEGSLGFITSMSKNFCGGCNRIRLTADGNLKVCLFGASEISLRDELRRGDSDEDLERPRLLMII